ncbi:complex I intermediate-associated protein 30-domain-containing protein [Hyaloraphidium curvatum]|nr:complex I intermediate-associated protein 30-domain-containing protein [Hyaloraphidium curvatum]
MASAAASRLGQYLKRSMEYAGKQTAKSFKTDFGEWRAELPMYTLNSQADLANWVVGSDKDMGGRTEATLELTPENKGRFCGNLSTDVPPGLPGNIKALGYAACKAKPKQLTLFHTPSFDTTLFRYLAVRCRGDGRQWFVNLQTNSPIEQDLYQHRLFFETPGEWETIMIPFRDFLLTNHGWIQKRQIEMDRMQVRSVGFSIVRQPGPFELEIDWIKAMNTEETFGDHDLVQKGEYVDEDGVVRKEGG